MGEEAVYEDSLVKVTPQKIELKNYYFPFLNSKRLAMNEVDRVTVQEPSLWNGQWRIWGTGNFAAWYPLDLYRPSRKRIYTLFQRGRSIKVCFTVEEPDRFEDSIASLRIVRN